MMVLRWTRSGRRCAALGLVGTFVLAGCAPRGAVVAAPAPPVAATGPGVVTLSVVGTNDLHGGILPRDGKGGLSLLAGYLANLRKARAADGGAVLLVDAGDMFQGTLESNLNEGAAVIRAYNVMGYDAAAVGNHEFDFGPAGEAATAAPGQDPLGALKARAAESRFPFLAANLIDRATGKPVAFLHLTPQAMVEKAGVKIGIVGVTTESTLTTTMPGNVRGLALAPLAETIVREAASLRRAGAVVVVVASHAGGSCTDFANPADLSTCQPDAEIMRVARELPAGTVDLIVAGHVHLGMAHRVNGVPIIESFSGGRAFGRVDLKVDRRSGRVVDVAIQRPQDLLAGSYEGAPVVADARIDALLAPDIERARLRKQEKLGLVLAEDFRRAPDREPLGNLVTDWMRATRPGATLAIVNGGGLRADLPAGELTYGALYELLPFDNRFATAEMRGRDLRRIIAKSLQPGSARFFLSGLRVMARCAGGALEVTTEPPLADDQPVTLLMSDFLATGGDGLELPPGGIRIEEGPPMRDEIARVLRAAPARTPLRLSDVVDPARPRIEVPGERPVRCPSP